MIRRMTGVAFLLSAAACSVVQDGEVGEVADEQTAVAIDDLGVTYIRVDDQGISHVTAWDEKAGYAGLCYAMARDRLFQMDVLRRSAQGRLAEIYGPGAGDSILGQDLLARAQNLPAFAAARYAAAAPRTKRVLQGCAAGVNQYISAAKASSSGLPLEFQTLGYEPAPWTPEDSVLAYIYVGVTFDTLTWFTKLERAAVASIAGTDVATTLIKEAPDDVSMFDAQGNLNPISQFLVPPGATAPSATIVNPPPPTCLDGARQVTEQARRMAPASGRASNAWAVDGHLTSTGKPLLATDPHFPHSTPSAVYVAQLKISGQYNVAGWMVPGFPGFISGHTDRIAWVPTYSLFDSVDLYVETLRGASGGGEEVLVNGEWKPVTRRVETIRVKGQADVQRTFRATPHGPVLNDGLDGLEAFGTLALKSTSGQPEWKVDGYFEMPAALNWTQFRAAALKQSIGWNFIFADYAGEHGHIGYQNSGLAPQRESPLNALYPVPGTGGHEWTGYATNAELPSVYDPPSHILMTANHRIVPRNYAPQGRPVHLANYWDMPWRAQRIATRLTTATGPITPEDMASIQLDTQTTIGLPLRDSYVAALGRAGLPADDPSAAAAMAALQQWDGNAAASSQGAAVYEMLTLILLRNTVRDVIGPDEYAFFAPNVFLTNQLNGLIDVLANPRAPYFGIVPGVDPGAARDQAVRAALGEADAMLRDALGSDVSAWTWGGIHELKYNHPLAGEDERFEIGTFPATGDVETLNIGGWFAKVGILDLPPGDFEAAGGVRGALDQDSLSATRLIWNLAPLDGSLGVMSTGNSGDPRTCNYSNHAEAWRSGQLFPIPFTSAAIP
ncbi:penicillin acylase family protein [Sorangium sp. So ce1389]|uniref:penicillin acylase family protein n=1 Tax=Sorangium sp. So ce1389 TaxID=3133336 RepID=UPI003F6215A2